MIIEIKDLPKDRNVKKVRFDIEFEDGDVKVISGTPTFDSGVTYADVEPTIEPTQNDYNGPENNEPTPVTSDIVEDIEQREQKAVPNEMLDMEF